MKMKYSSTTIGVLLVGLSVTHPTPSVTSGGQQASVQVASPTVSAGMPIYNPPKRGIPGARLGGGTRSADRHVTLLSVLAPDHTGLTVQEQPTLYWYLSRQTTYPVLFTVIEIDSMKTVLEVRLPAPPRTGVQAIRLSDHGLHLASGVQYQWFVALMIEPDRRSKDIMAGGMIERTPLSKELSSKLAGVGRSHHAALYAEAGLWYDAVEAISEEIVAVPNDPGLRKQRASLLEQVGLPEVATGDLSSGANERS